MSSCKHGMNPDWCSVCKNLALSSKDITKGMTPHAGESGSNALIDALVQAKALVHLEAGCMDSELLMREQLSEAGIDHTKIKVGSKGSPGTGWKLIFKQSDLVNSLVGNIKVTKHSHHDGWCRISCKDAVIKLLQRGGK